MKVSKSKGVTYKNSPKLETVSWFQNSAFRIEALNVTFMNYLPTGSLEWFSLKCKVSLPDKMYL